MTKSQKLPSLSGKEVVKALSKIGFIVIRQKGSHVILKKQTAETTIGVVVPNHDEVDKGTLLEIIRQSRLTKQDFINLL